MIRFEVRLHDHFFHFVENKSDVASVGGARKMRVDVFLLPLENVQKERLHIHNIKRVARKLRKVCRHRAMRELLRQQVHLIQAKLW